MVVYEQIPDGYDYNTKFDTYILAFCPDTESWFATNERFFFYEYQQEFTTEEDAIDFFKRNPQIFLELEEKQLMKNQRPSFLKNKVWIDIADGKHIEIEINRK